jgi:hypothetical protein
MKTMKSAAFGVRAHSGWAALVAVAGSIQAPEILDRRRISLVDPSAPSPKVPGHGPEQPFHIAKELNPEEAAAYLARSAKIASRLAHSALAEVAAALLERGFRINGCGILLASGRALPALEQILASHPMIHTAEGEFFRNAIREACRGIGIAVTAVRERDLLTSASEKLDFPAAKIKRKMEELRYSAGSPWTADQKKAAVAGLLALGYQENKK